MILRTGLAFAITATALLLSIADVHAAAWRYSLDLRTLPAHSRPAAARAEIDARTAARGTGDVWISLAINGMVIARQRAAADRVTVINVPLQDRLLSTQNEIEIAAVQAGCAVAACEAVLDAIRPLGAVRFRLGKPQDAADDFSQLVTVYRAGIAVQAGNDRERALAGLVREALAPKAPLDPNARARLHVGKAPPAGADPLIRFDRGPVRLVREDGPVIFAPDALDRMTVIQMLSGGERPTIWVRPGTGAPPGKIDLSDGNIALFDGSGRAMAFSTLRDHRAVRIDYPGGHDPYGNERRMMIWRLGLLGFWMVASVFLFIVYRRLPRPQVSKAAA